jgi:hypothetical protein
MAGRKARRGSRSVTRRVTTAPTAPATGMLMRFRADDIAQANGSLVASWGETSGNSLPAAAQGDSTKQPTLVTNLINGHAVVQFDGIDNFLSLSGSALAVSQNRAAVGIFIAYRYASAATGVRTLFGVSSGTGATSTRTIVYQRDTGGVMGMGGRRLDADSAQFISASVASTAGTNEVIGACFDFTNNDAFLYKNGTQVGASTSFQTAGSTSNTISLAGTIGANLAGAAEFANVGIAEILVYSAVDSTTRTELADYFQATYGITMSDATSTVGSGVAMPTGDLPGWTYLEGEDFNTDFAEGEYRAQFGIEWDRYHNAGASVQAGQYEGVYRLDLTASASDSALRIRCHKVAGQTYAWVGAPTPWDGIPQLYGRYAMRLRTTPTTNSDYKMAWLLWPYEGGSAPNPGAPYYWWEYGEIDFPETELGGNAGGFSHDVTGSPGSNVLAYSGGPDTEDWHTYVIEWTPSRVTFLIDGTQVAQTTNPDGIPTVAMRWVLQTETNLDRPHFIPAGSQADVYLDWIAVWAYNP